MKRQTVIGGNGTIGQVVVKRLQEMGKPVRIVQPKPHHITGKEELAVADVFDQEALDAAVKDSEVVYLILGLPYSAKVWMEGFPKAVQNTIRACKRAGARMVYFDNVYMYGKVEGPMTEETPHSPVSQKGEARKRAAEILLQAMQSSEIEALIARSADFYGPYEPFDIVKRTADALMKGKKADVVVEANKKHSLTFIPDAGNATAALGNLDQAYGQVWHLPTAPDPPTGAELVAMIGQLIGKPGNFRVLPRWLISLLGLFNSELREMKEMLYQYEYDYLFDSSKIEQAFGLKATPYREGLEQYLRELGRVK